MALVQVIISSSLPGTLSKGIGGAHLSSGDRMTLEDVVSTATATVLCNEHFWADVSKELSLEFEDRFVILSSFCSAFVMFTWQQCCVRS